MISIERVKGLVKSLSGYDDSELEEFSEIISTSVQCAQQQINDEGQHSNPLVEMLAAAMANYQLAIINMGDGVTAFTAGDVSINQSADSIKNARLLLDDAKENVAELIADSGFAFLGV